MFPVSLLSAVAFSAASPQSICETDDRQRSDVPAVGVVTDKKSGEEGFCTLTLVSETCAITAGHCLNVLGEARFFTDLNHAKANDPAAFVYSVDPTWVRALQTRIGNNWAVVRLRANPKTGLVAGKVHGFIETELEKGPLSDAGLELHAVQAAAPERALFHKLPSADNRTQGNVIEHFELQKSEGELLWSEGSVLYHNLDTTAGSSGALVIDKATGKAVGIHTHGGCDTMKNNKATFIAEVPYLVKAIKACRASEFSFKY